jgi:anti-anti-sigma regulatory factor
MNMAGLYLATHMRPGGVDIVVVGPLTVQTTPQIRTALSRHTPTVTRLRLRACTAIDPDGLCALLLAHIEAGESGGNLHLLDVPPLIERYLHDHHASHLLPPSRGEIPP